MPLEFQSSRPVTSSRVNAICASSKLDALAELSCFGWPKRYGPGAILRFQYPFGVKVGLRLHLNFRRASPDPYPRPPCLHLFLLNYENVPDKGLDTTDRRSVK